MIRYGKEVISTRTIVFRETIDEKGESMDYDTVESTEPIVLAERVIGWDEGGEQIITGTWKVKGGLTG